MIRDRPGTSVEGVLEILSSTSRLLAGAADAEAALPAICSLLVPGWADGCAVALIDEEGNLRPIYASGLEAGQMPLRPGARTRLVPLPEERWLLDVPIAARNESFGLLRLYGAEAEPPTILPQLADEIALRVAIAIETARTLAREHRVADTLQRALLPDHLPRTPHVAFDAAYRPGTSESIVGGDWYDAFELPDGRIAVSIGDVAGHGLSAAVVMSEVRQTVRAAALNAKSPSDVLARANQMLTMRTTTTMVTALFGTFDPASSTFTYAAAGHPGPLIGMPAGRVEELPSGGLPLGISDELDAHDWTFTLLPHTLLVLYTDGLTEYGRDVIAGEEALLEAVAEELAAPSRTPAKTLQERIFRARENTDDVATLTLYVEPREREAFEFTFTAVPCAVPIVRRSFERFLMEHGVDGDRRFAAITAVGEAVANAVEHAYPHNRGTVRIRAWVEVPVLRIQIEDSGRWRAATKEEERGRGIPLMRALADGVEIRTDRSSTTIRMRLRISP